MCPCDAKCQFPEVVTAYVQRAETNIKFTFVSCCKLMDDQYFISPQEHSVFSCTISYQQSADKN